MHGHLLPIPLAQARSPWRGSTHSFFSDSLPTTHQINSYSSLKTQLQYHLLCEASLTPPSSLQVRQLRHREVNVPAQGHTPHDSEGALTHPMGQPTSPTRSDMRKLGAE